MTMKIRDIVRVFAIHSIEWIKDSQLGGEDRIVFVLFDSEEETVEYISSHNLYDANTYTNIEGDAVGAVMYLFICKTKIHVF